MRAADLEQLELNQTLKARANFGILKAREAGDLRVPAADQSIQTKHVAKSDRSRLSDTIGSRLCSMTSAYDLGTPQEGSGFIAVQPSEAGRAVTGFASHAPFS